MSNMDRKIVIKAEIAPSAITGFALRSGWTKPGLVRLVPGSPEHERAGIALGRNFEAEI